MCNLPRERQVLLTRTQEGEGTARDAWHGPQPTLLNVHTDDRQGAEQGAESWTSVTTESLFNQLEVQRKGFPFPQLNTRELLCSLGYHSVSQRV